MKKLFFWGVVVMASLLTSCTQDETFFENENGLLEENVPLAAKGSEGSNEVVLSSNELIIQYKEGTTSEQIANLKKIHKADISRVKKCDGCFEDTFIVELWELVEGIDPIEKKGALKGDGAGGPEDIIKDMDVNFSFTKEDEIKGTILAPSSNQDLTTMIAKHEGIVIAVVDTGIDANNSDLFGDVPFLHETSSSCEPQIHSGWDFAYHDDNPFDGDPRRHGTKVSYIIANKLNSLDVPHEILPVKVFKDDRSTTYFNILCGVNYALKKIHDSGRNGLVNLSFGYLSNAESSNMIFANLLKRYPNIPVIASAGNKDENNDSVSHYPSSHSENNVIAVTSTNMDYFISYFSNYGKTSVDFYARGEDLSLSGPQYDPVHGTSFSAATVTAKVAEYLHTNNSYTMSDIVSHLNKIGKPLAFQASKKQTVYNKVIE